jgi:hypothetical protein
VGQADCIFDDVPCESHECSEGNVALEGDEEGVAPG